MTPAPPAAGAIRRAIAGTEVGPRTAVVEARRLMEGVLRA